jgi:hypothetical protein
MNQVVHIFRKDCRHLWRIIAAVLVLTYLHGYAAVINSGGGMALGRPAVVLLLLTGLSVPLLPITLFLLVVSVIQEESLVGSDKFWLTRPYSRLSLFLEKLSFILLWAVVPMLVHDVVLIRHFGFSLSSAFGLLVWKNAQFGFFLLVAATLAVLSASFARAVLLAIGAVLVTVLTFLTVSQNTVGPSIASWTANYEILMVLAVAAVGAVCVIAFQYRFRIASVAAAIAVVAILVCALLSHFWPSSLSAYLLRKNESPLLRSIQILPDADLKDVAWPHEAPNPAVQSLTAYYPFRASGLPDNVAVGLVGLSAHFDSPGQKSPTLYLAAWVRFQPAAGGPRQFADVGGPDQLVSFASAVPGDSDRLKDTDGTLSGNLVLQGFRSAVARVPVPLPGTRQAFAVGGRRCSAQSFLHERKLLVTIDCVELEPGSTAEFQVRLLENNREIMPSSTGGQPSSAGSWPSFLSPIASTSSQIDFDLPGLEGLAGESTLGLEMVVFAEQSLGAEVRTFRIEHFRPGEFSLHAWEQRGVLRAESTGTQSTGGTVPKTQ